MAEGLGISDDVDGEGLPKLGVDEGSFKSESFGKHAAVFRGRLSALAEKVRGARSVVVGSKAKPHQFVCEAAILNDGGVDILEEGSSSLGSGDGVGWGRCSRGSRGRGTSYPLLPADIGCGGSVSGLGCVVADLSSTRGAGCTAGCRNKENRGVVVRIGGDGVQARRTIGFAAGGVHMGSEGGRLVGAGAVAG